ncbi:putative ssDNA-binding protein [Escherichia phage vB_EcoS_NBD2]|uniref:Putative ssDNA-binding protein n=1 Tax=Escherichia phage vB_EcoS_NBD2 TaxID=1852563 RepID=A0A192Y8G1_9CAUD|nr:putative ssDNA-binding protein [Escherichia phage vB_EcoS_NBD2]ANM45898.1 putative ssDNA-binding protein [Escherichia phage vB_EcoS_NBD2]
MPHTITGEIRKAPYTKDGSNNNGRWKMYAVDLSERMKVKVEGQEQTVYTNYRAVFFANENMLSWYDEAFQLGKVVSISCDTLNITSRDSNGTVYTTAEMIRPQLVFSQRGAQQQSGGNHQGGNQQQQGWGQPQQPQQQNNPPPNRGNQFDDDIPF